MSDTVNNGLAVRQEQRQVRASDGLLGWVPAIAIGYATILTPLLVFRTTPAVEDPAIAAAASGSNLLNQVFWLFLLVSTAFAFRHRLARFEEALKQPVVVLVGLYMLLAFASIVWSPAPSIAFRRATLQFIVIATVVLPAFLVDDPRAQIDRVMAVFFVTIAINLVAVLLLPAGRLGHQGIYTHKNELGLVVAYGFVFCLYGVWRLSGLGRLIALALAAAAQLELVVSKSKTSLGLALLIPLIALAVVAASRFLRINALYPLFFGLLACLFGGLFVANLVDFSFADFSMLLFDDTTFTGRTIIWDFLGDVISRRPILGQGYGSFWDIGPGSIVLTEAPGFVATLLQGHSGYVDVTVELGLAGLAVLLAFLACVLLSVGRAPNDGRTGMAEAWLFMSVVIVTLCHNMLESSWFRGYSVVWMLFLLVGAWAQAGRRQARGNRGARQRN
ncbi:MAG TPA: O-antigen ligase family protein [Shinella sp.]|uniref:O-antigen ligase family protein n=1 Tax=Shinella sp. TaxID=1870904 RepID=UPI002E12754F|nr:O-antigen ligase family protein [Shinella sp.]